MTEETKDTNPILPTFMLHYPFGYGVLVIGLTEQSGQHGLVMWVAPDSPEGRTPGDMVEDRVDETVDLVTVLTFKTVRDVDLMIKRLRDVRKAIEDEDDAVPEA
jgi:hypothetical protein